MLGVRAERFSDTQVKGIEVSPSLLGPLWPLPDEVVKKESTKFLHVHGRHYEAIVIKYEQAF